MKFRLATRAPMFADLDPETGGGGAAPTPTDPNVSRETPPVPTQSTVEAPRPDIERALAWNEDTDGPLPKELASIPASEVRDYVANAKATAAAEAAAAARDEWNAEQERKRQESEGRAKIEEEIRWAEELDKRRGSADESERAAAQAEYEANKQRFIDAFAQNYRIRESGAVVQAVNKYLEPQINALRDGGHVEFVNSALDRARAHDGNLLLAAIEYGKGLGETTGYDRGVEEEKQRQSVERGTQNPTPGGQPSGSGNPFSGIDTTRVGAGAQMARAALAGTS